MSDTPSVAAGRGPDRPLALFGHPWTVLAAIAVGGMLGALGRAVLAGRFPTRAGGFAWATFGINITGCLLIGALMVLVGQVWTGRPLLRPFLGTGVLGGYTTFSGYVVDAERALASGALGVALGYLVLTPVAAVLAAYLGSALTRAAIRPRSGTGE